MIFGRVGGAGWVKDCFGTRPSILSDQPRRSVSGLLLAVASLVSRSRLKSEEEGATFGYALQSTELLLGAALPVPGFTAVVSNCENSDGRCRFEVHT